MSQNNNPSEAREREIFLQALEKTTPVERDAFIEAACAGDEGLRAAVHGLLSNTSAPLLDQVAEAARASLDISISEQPGDMIGRYKLLEKLGEGGFGAVYMAEQREPVKRRVALKIIKAGMDTREVVARFEAERQALALMDHPNIAKVFDAGTTEKGRPYFALELVRGVKITDYCEQNRLDLNARLKLFIQVCQAVQHAHQKGIIHRDLKPSNILVTLHDGVAVPKVIDFGIAKATQQELSEKTVFTRFHQFIGTPAYMSPEQAELSGLDIDTRSDIYSLGVLLYELLTGATPFDGQELLKAGLDEMRRIIREQEPVRPSTRISPINRSYADSRPALSIRHSSLSADLDWIVMKCLEKDRARRYETANGVAADIQRHLANEPVVARPPSSSYRMRKAMRRNRVAFATGSAVALTLIFGMGISSWQAIEKSRAFRRAKAAEQEQTRLRSRAETSEQETRIQAMKSEQVAQFLTDMLRAVGPSVALGRDTALLRDILEKTESRVSRQLANQPEVQVEVNNTIGYVYSDLGDLSKAEARVNAALSRRHELDGGRHLQVARSLTLLGNLAYTRGDFVKAEAAARESLALRRDLLGETNREVANSINNLANAIERRGDVAQAEEKYRAALTLARKLEHDPTLLNLVIYNLARIRNNRGDFLEAETLLKESIEISRSAFGTEHPDTADSMELLGVVLTNQGKWAEGIKLYVEVLLIQRKLWGPRHPKVAITLLCLADLLINREGDLGKGEDYAREALTIRLSSKEPNAASLAEAMNKLAEALNKQGKIREAESVFQDALTLLKRGFATPADFKTSFDKWITTLRDQGRSGEIEKWIGDRLNSTPDPITQSSRLLESDLLKRRGNMRARAGRWSDAAADFAQAIELDPEDHEQYHCLAPLLIKSGDLGSYRQHCQKEVARFVKSDNPFTAERMAKDCLILADSGVDLKVVAAWTDLAVSAGNELWALPWFQCTKSLASYRQGRFAEAVEWTQKALAEFAANERNSNSNFMVSYRDVQSLTVLAMSQFRLGQAGAARATFNRVAELESHLRKLESGDIGEGWLDWIISRVLFGEAKQLIERSDSPGFPASTVSITPEAQP